MRRGTWCLRRNLFGDGMQEFAKSFYKSRRWQHTRLAYLKSVGGLCENCLKKGLYHPATMVHHIIPIDANNIYNPEVTLSWSNLCALCDVCHAEQHYGGAKRYKVREDGTIEIR